MAPLDSPEDAKWQCPDCGRLVRRDERCRMPVKEPKEDAK